MVDGQFLYLQVYVNGCKCKKFASRGEIENIKGVNVGAGAFIYQVKLERKLVGFY